ncbi:unnamed protein product [Soboliphyme baturini]|uniref:ABC transporter domain-containing protein n=1 Tax=Soboliphyme baturini TaxID=241478 RepID=A0A183IM68_9BILA|nr:unnamed protein product [Soboliphyme baturini]
MSYVNRITVSFITFKILGKLVQKYSSQLPKVLFVPQKPYFPSGTLRQQIVYPCRAVYCTKSIHPHKLVNAISLKGDLDIKTDNKLLDYMQMLKLEYLLERTNGLDEPVNFDWNHMLTPGEMQRLSIMRVLFHKPSIVFLDEATSAEGITCVSVGHRDSLRKFHDLELNLDSNGSWHLIPISAKYHVKA